MAKKKVKKGEKLACVPCGREIVIDDCCVTETDLWCCGKPMKKKASIVPKKKKARVIKKKKK